MPPEDLEPKVEPFSFYLEAYRELSTCRPSGFGISAIPFVAVVEYAKLYEIVGEDFEDFLYIIRSMDSEQIRLEQKKQKPNVSDTSKGNKGRN